MLIATLLFILYAGLRTGNLSPVFSITALIGFIIAAYMQISNYFKSRKLNTSDLLVDRGKTPEVMNKSQETPTIEQKPPDQADKPKESVNAIRKRDSEKLKSKAAELEKSREEEALLREALQNIEINTHKPEAKSTSITLSTLPYSAENLQPAKIKVIGIGGGGSNAINRMIDAKVEGVEFLAVNTDLQALRGSRSRNKLQIGARVTKGLGVGGDPELGRKAALEDTKKIIGALKDIDMVFLTAGFGGGTGTGGAPIFARIAKELGILTVAIVTMPFDFEGHIRRLHAQEGLVQLLSNVDTLITVHNERLLTMVAEETTLIESFSLADEILRQAVQGISDIIAIPGLINVDFADVKTIMSKRGIALMGIGEATGENRAIEAVEQATKSPLLEGMPISGAEGLLINVTGGADLTLYEVNKAMTMIHEMTDPEADVIFGAAIDEQMMEGIKITVIATGFPNEIVQSEMTDEDVATILEFRSKRIK